MLLWFAGAVCAFGVDATPTQKVWTAGAYSFSDELGGFRITGVSGVGTGDDPIIVEQELSSASPVTLVIRAVGVVQPYGRSGLTPNGFLHMRVVARNGSGIAWVEFGLELQEVLEQPSVFGDGLSFDQRRSEPEIISSSAFKTYNRDFEPYDRLLFQNGKVDPSDAAGFSFLITDYTPRQTFFLVEDPRIPSS